ncbi:MAG: 1,4-alpha-glucan branching protein GlgB [Bryobacteraceae bacterium]
MSLLSDQDRYFFQEGTHLRIWNSFGAHHTEQDAVPGVNFAVWAPHAQSVSVIGDFNNWDAQATPLKLLGQSGIWEAFVPRVPKGTRYKYRVRSSDGAYVVDKSDPVGFFHAQPPDNSSIVWNLDYQWGDQAWMSARTGANSLDAPISIYEVHLGSWRRIPEENNRWLHYNETASYLVPYLKEMGFTHVEFLPVMEHPFYGSWGYETTGFFAPTSRYGAPQQLMSLIDQLHQNGIGVILDWVPSHFPQDEHGLGYFDGMHEYEHADPRQGIHPDWNSFIFNYRRPEVRSFLLSSAIFWLEQFHADALRVDAVASMLYLDYSRKEGEWIPNRFGGRENLEAIGFLRTLNERLFGAHPDIQTIAEESTAWPMVSKPAYIGGLGFGMKWDMGWMHDTLAYFAQDPIFRKYHHHELTFRMMYAFAENFVLPLSHDEVVYGKRSLLNKMPGDNWRKFAGLRLLLAYMFGQPGKKLLFMGSEFGQWNEWNHETSLDWGLLQRPNHAGIRLLVGDLNNLYKTEAAMHDAENCPSSFEWIDSHDGEKNILSFLRKDRAGNQIAIVYNFSPVPRPNYRIGVPIGGMWREMLNTDAKQYGGSGQGNFGGVEAGPVPLHGRSHSLTINVPPLGAVVFKP